MVNSLGADLMPIPNVTSPNFAGIGADILRVDPALMQQVASYQQPTPTAAAAPLPPPVKPPGSSDGDDRNLPREEWLRRRMEEGRQGQRRPGDGGGPSPSPSPSPSPAPTLGGALHPWLAQRLQQRGGM